MKCHLKSLAVVANGWRLWPSLMFVAISSPDAPIRADIRRWAQILFHEYSLTDSGLLWHHAWLMTYYPEYRNLAYIRLPMSRFYGWLMPKMGSLAIFCDDLGPGCFIQHGFATMVSARRIGANFWLNQQVTIGYSNDTDMPEIGDDVTVRPGAKIVGRVKIGNGATVGMNTVVTGNVPAHATVFGVPGQVIWRKAPAQ
jgi:serine O-acetyltransferase